MTREKFDTIVIEEGILTEEARDVLWETRPHDLIDEECLRIVIRKIGEERNESRNNSNGNR